VSAGDGAAARAGRPAVARRRPEKARWQAGIRTPGRLNPPYAVAQANSKFRWLHAPATNICEAAAPDRLAVAVNISPKSPTTCKSPSPGAITILSTKPRNLVFVAQRRRELYRLMAEDLGHMRMQRRERRFFLQVRERSL